ncbi:hypothetical protein GCK72_016964 [Caenorhabditis remanei]|uniref:RING-CH-type domain-containing protein n=1 Tax=Caenorhabditis remanei TaxID=31234 RepID=A0A6A5G771_CAERE|nr:hypothetical protein GCK72_016964 [Caenorhabditis remanei]KAF1750414.1 hypothetical protein GCK72_016964 [Caenorhabditis remanei]
MSLKPTQAETPPKGLRPAWLFDSLTESTISASRRICRICQMHEGEMVRPCDCAGTMGDVHEECLTKWVTMSNKKNCEICKSEYSKSGAQFKPFKEWSKPKPDMKNVFHIFLIIILSILITYVCIIMEERYFHERIIAGEMLTRPDDTGRIFLIIVLALAILNNLYTLAMRIVLYLKKQRRIRFINKHSQ